MSKPRAIGLKNATEEEIQKLIDEYPQGYHVTHTKKGKKLPYNGVFYCYGKISNILHKWAHLKQPNNLRITHE